MWQPADRGKSPGGAQTIPKEHVSDDLPVPQVVKEDLEVIKVPQKRYVVPHVPEETAELVKLVAQERVQQRTVEAQFTGDFPLERISERTQIVDEPVPQIAKETVEAVRVVQREHMQQWTVDAPTLQELKETVEMVISVLHERAQQHTAKQIFQLWRFWLMLQGVGRRQKAFNLFQCKHRRCLE